MDRKVWTETLIEVGNQLCLGSAPLSCCLGLPTPSPPSHQPQHPGARRDLWDHLGGGILEKLIFGKVSKLASELRMFLQF